MKKSPFTVSELRALMGSIVRELARIEAGESGWDFQEEAFRSSLKKLEAMVPPGSEEAARPV